jgi:putative transposase
MKAMQQALNFGKSVNDNGWGIFIRLLGYKLDEQGKRLIKIDRWFPSSADSLKCATVLLGYN